MVFLQSHGVGTARAVRIYKTYGADAIPLVKEDPYRLARDTASILKLARSRSAPPNKAVVSFGDSERCKG